MLQLRGGPSAQVFTNGQSADLLITRDATGLVSDYINGTLVSSGLDDGNETFSGTNNIIWFFMDDLRSLTSHPSPAEFEAGSGFIQSITVSNGVPEPSTWAMMILGFAGVGFMAYRRKKTRSHSFTPTRN